MLGFFYTFCYYVTMAGIRTPPEDSDVSSARPLTTTDMVSDDDHSVAANSWSIKSNYGSTLDDDQRHAHASEALSAALYPAASDYSSSDKEPDAEPVGSMLGFQSYWDAAYADELANFRQYGHMTANLLVCIILLLVSGVKSYEISHKIHTLPGQPEVMFNQFSGYVDVEQSRKLFYYFVEAQSKPASRPLVLWLNGGPGCSSVGLGAFSENGPFMTTANGNLIKNEFSWNKESNMLYLDSPAGVGFSYSSNKSFYDYVDDEITAQDTLVFLEHWLEMYPEYKGREFIITGESYIGHYAPQLAQLIIERSDINISLRGIAMGNPLLEYFTNYNSRPEFFWSHGLISADSYRLFKTVCNYSEIDRQIQAGGPLTPDCLRVARQAATEIGPLINSFDVSLDFCLSDNVSHSQVSSQKFEKACMDEYTLVYMNREDVKKALHAKLIGVTRWFTCTQVLHYDIGSIQAPTINLLGKLVKLGIRILVYSGDQDSFIPLGGTQLLVDGLAEVLSLNTTVSYTSWLAGGQVGGWIKVYGDLLFYATVRGAGHEATQSKPMRSLVLFKAFLDGKLPLIPQPSNTSIIELFNIIRLKF